MLEFQKFYYWKGEKKNYKFESWREFLKLFLFQTKKERRELFYTACFFFLNILF